MILSSSHELNSDNVRIPSLVKKRKGTRLPQRVVRATALPLSLVLVALSHSAANGGAWVQKERGHFFKLTAGYLYTTEEYDNRGNIRSIREGEPGISNTSYMELSATGYLEYGVAKRFTVAANLPFKVVTSRRTETSTEGLVRNVEVVTGGLSDLTLSGRFLLFGTVTPLSIQAGVKLPLGYDATPPDGGAPLGSGKVDVEAWVLGGASIWPIRAYATGQAGYRLRGGAGIADEYLFQIEGGFTPGNWLAKATLEGVHSKGAADDQQSSTVVITNQDVLKIIPTIAYRFHRRFSVVTELIHIIEGKNTVAGTTYSAGIVLSN